MRDCTARQKHDEHNKRRNGRLYKQEKEDGTRIASKNLSGSQFDFEFMLEQCTDHTLAHLKGWQGVWEPAKVTEKIRMESMVDQEELQYSLGMAD
eukprot:9803881-Heterocapsa_arctica.AAC.1